MVWPLMEAASYFRTGLTKDLETRDRSGSIAAILAWREERAAAGRADARLRALTAAAPTGSGTAGTHLMHRLTPEDERMDGDELRGTTEP